MDRDAISRFWRERAATGRTRWTDDAFLAYEQAMLAALITPGASILDLGSGFGELSRSVCPPDGRLIAVDQEPLFAAPFDDDPRCTFVRSDVVSFHSDEQHDLVLLFGVVTHLTTDEEREVYRHIAGFLRPGGNAVVKNQCADGETFEVDTFSTALGTRYVGRYPSIADQTTALRTSFAEVQPIPYPPELRVHADSSHVAFVCRAGEPAGFTSRR